MIRSVLIAALFGLAIPAIGYLVSIWILGDVNALWAEEIANDADFTEVRGIPLEDLCLLVIDDVGGSWKPVCDNLIQLVWLKTASIWCGGISIGLLTLYFIASIICGTNRRLISIIFPILVPLTTFVVAILIFVQGGILTYAAYEAEIHAIQRVHYFLIGGIGLGALIGGFGLLSNLISFKSRAETNVFGVSLNNSDFKQLWNYIDELASKLDSRMPDNIVVGLDPTFYVTSADVNIFPGKSKLTGETLYLSLPLMRLFNKDELSAVVGHELGHFRGKDTAYSLKFAPIYSGLAKSIASLGHAEGVSALASIPALSTLRAMFDIFSINESKISRIREFEADNAGVSVSSSESLAVALAKVVVFSSVWKKVRSDNITRLNANKAVSNLSEIFEDSAKYDISHTSLEELIENILPAQITHPTDSHPSIKDRYENMGFDISNLNVKKLTNVGSSSKSLVGKSLNKVEQEVTEIEHQLMIALGHVTVGGDLSEEEENQQRQQSVYIKSIYILAATMIGADGKIEKSEINTAEEIGKRLLNSFDEVEFRAFCKNAGNLPPFKPIAEMVSSAYDEKDLKKIYSFLKEIAGADGEVSSEEKALLEVARKCFFKN